MGSYPTAPTFVANEAVTSAKMQQLAAAVAFALNPPSVGAYVANAAAIVGDGTYVAIPFDGETVDVVQSGDVAAHSTTTNPSRIYARTAGRYGIGGHIAFSSNATGVRRLALRKNSTGSISTGSSLFVTRTGAVSGDETGMPVPYIEVDLAAGDWIELFASQTSGASLNVQPGANTSWITFRCVAS